MRAGRLILMGSGETSNRLLAAHRLGIEAAKAHQVLVLDTPYGFQENATLNSEKLATFFTTSLSIEAGVVSYRSAEAGALACEEMLAAVRRARYVFAGPGSPTYALGVWKETPLASALRDLLSTGATVTVASAAALTAGVKTLPVYEIYKVGSGLGWLEGLDLTSHLGLEAVFIPHWNNTEGQGFDTSRCYMGRRRFELLKAMLPAGLGIIGVDDHTAAVIDFGKGELSVIGAGGVALCGERNIALGDGEYMELGTVLRLLGGYSPPAAGQQPDLLADLPQALANRSAREIAATPHQPCWSWSHRPLCGYWGGLVEAARIGVSGGVVTRGHSDLCFFDLICPTPPRRPWAFRCWPDQKPVRACIHVCVRWFFEPYRCSYFCQIGFWWVVSHWWYRVARWWLW